jgi:type VI secretion system secreted protein Hcp
MAYDFVVRITAQKQGELKSEITAKGREGTIRGLAFRYGLDSPRDPHSGLARGHRQHRLIEIMKEFDRTSPLLFAAMVQNENLTKVVLEFYKVTTGGAAMAQAKAYYTITLHNANVVRLEMAAPHAFKSTWYGGEGSHPPTIRTESTQIAGDHEFEWVSFTFQKIEIVFTQGGVAASDDWVVSM